MHASVVAGVRPPIRNRFVGVQGATGKSPLAASAEAEIFCEAGKEREALFQPSTRNLFLVRGFARPAGRARYFPSLESTQRVPQAAFSPKANTQVAKRLGFRKAKANLGRPRGACVVAAPGPPVAKEPCAASLARARPARITCVPGRAAVAYGAVDPSPGSWTPVDP